ncbi:MAG: hypothetical protein ACK5LL_17395 [Suipraeoptans sp.]
MKFITDCARLLAKGCYEFHGNGDSRSMETKFSILAWRRLSLARSCKNTARSSEANSSWILRRAEVCS